MNFDQRFKAEAETLFDSRSPLEILDAGSSTWMPLSDVDAGIADIVFNDRKRAVELAKYHGVELSDGRHVRFAISPPC